MSNREEFIFWKIAESLIVDNGYRIIKLFSNGRELWLEKRENKQAQMVRLLNEDFAWASSLARDVESVATASDKVRRQMRLRKLNVLTIYISGEPPVDDYRHRIMNPFIKKNGLTETAVHPVLLANGMAGGPDDMRIAGLGKQITELLTSEVPNGDEAEKSKAIALHHAKNVSENEKALFKYGKPAMTYFFIALQILVFLLMELDGGSTNPQTLIKYGAKFNPLILQGEWWRLIAPVALHIGFLHLAMNTLGLYFIGAAAERILGSTRFLIVYLAAGFSGSLASFLFSHELSAGASGAIFGCLGALLYFGLSFPSLFFRTLGPSVFFIVIFNLAFGFSVSMVDNAGHIGGLAGGFLAAGAVGFPKHAKPLKQAVFAAAAAVLAIGMLNYGYAAPLGKEDERSVLLLAEQSVKDGDYTTAYDILKEYESGNQATEKTYFLLSYTEIKKGLYDDAKAHLLEAIRLNGDFHEAHYNLALILLEQGNIEEARRHAKKAYDLKPGQDEYGKLLEDIRNTSRKGSMPGSL